MYFDYGKSYWAIDVEGDGLLDTVTQLWCLCAVNIITGEKVDCIGHEEIRNWINARRKERAVFIGHNIIGYDAPAINRLLGCSIGIAELIDTLVLSMVYSPSLVGGHALEDWGVRLRYPKGVFNDFSCFSQEMLDYCRKDTELCKRIYLNLVGRMQKIGFTERSCEIEHRAWLGLRKQKENGFAFNIKEAHALYALLRQEENELRDQVFKFWPPELQIVQRYKQARKKDGSYTSNYLRHKEQYVRVEELNDGGYVAWDYLAFNLGSPDQRRSKLLDLGWEPLEFTKPSKTHPHGQPQVTRKGSLVPSLVAFVEESGKEEVKLIAEWIDINARGNMVNTWIEAYNDRTGCIHGTLWLANTHRYKHSGPNTANIPAVRLDKEDRPLQGRAGVYTYEARDLWTVRHSDRRLVGVDAKGIQLRVLANYLNNKRFTEAILSADPHEANKNNMGLPTRAITKTITYATLMGAGDNRIAAEAKLSLEEAREAKAIFFRQVPELPDLIKRLEEQFKKTGRIRLCDGSWIIPPKPYMVIPYLLQGDEAKIMKQAQLYVLEEVRKRKLDVLKVGDIHDEWQNDVWKDHVDELRQDVYPVSFSRSGISFNYNLPIECDSKVGMTWAETH